MEVQHYNSLNRQPSFQMLYRSPKKWDRKVLQALRESKLAKEIDARFPNASVSYIAEPYISVKLNMKKNIEHIIDGASNASVIMGIKKTKLEDIIKDIAENTAIRDAEKREKKALVKLVKAENRKILINRIKFFFGFGKTNS